MTGEESGVMVLESGGEGGEIRQVDLRRADDAATKVRMEYSGSTSSRHKWGGLVSKGHPTVK